MYSKGILGKGILGMGIFGTGILGVCLFVKVVCIVVFASFQGS